MNVKIVSLFLAGAACVWAADAYAQGGPEVLRDQGCLECHDVRPDVLGPAWWLAGGGTGPDLANRLAADYTVPALAAALWNHTPAMWAEMSSTAATRPVLGEAEWEDVFRSLYALQFFDRPALARRGGRVFRSECASCHGVGTNDPGPGKPITEWTRIQDPIALVYRMWSHASVMKEAFGDGPWKRLDGEDFLDLTVYLQSVQNVPRDEQVTLPDTAEGRFLTAQHCGTCHGGSDTFAAFVTNKTPMDIGAATWNHVPLMESAPVLPPDDFRKIVAYVWELQYRGPTGVASRGELVFGDKGCISCHRSPGNQRPQSPRAGHTFTPTSMVALSWGSGREMHRQMQEQGVPWPQLSPDDVSNLVAYLNTFGP
jgi:mono/diheme cytochrome c family protein